MNRAPQYLPASNEPDSEALGGVRPSTPSPDDSKLGSPSIHFMTSPPPASRRYYHTPSSPRRGIVPRKALLRAFFGGAGEVTVALVLVCLLLGMAWFQPLAGTGAHAEKIPSVWATGLTRGNVTNSGQTVVFRWAKSLVSKQYELVWYSLPIPRQKVEDSAKHVHKIALSTPPVQIHMLGAQTYHWKVETTGTASGRRSSPWHSVRVLPPNLSAPRVATAPLKLTAPARAKVCWKSLKGASQYSVEVTGNGIKRENRTTGLCSSLVLRSGNYQVEVAGQAEGARLYTGPRSTVRIAVVKAAAPKKRSRSTTHRVARGTGTISGPSQGGTSGTSGYPSSGNTYGSGIPTPNPLPQPTAIRIAPSGSSSSSSTGKTPSCSGSLEYGCTAP